ncbi:MAG: Glutamate synthase (NADPH) large chain precursor [bacterium ADurb.Bin429]|nr:MAG: Glutamate synthase (NADPH) large chain precursor [bacterium ADurb.Bin429]
MTTTDQLEADQQAGVVIDAAGLHYRDLNRRVRELVAAGETALTLRNVRGQRYIGDGLKGKDVRITIHGVPGGDLAAFMDGPTLEVFGNGQDAACNTMNDGVVIIHGNAGDALGYGMRGGSLFVRGDAGYRVGIHMKAYKTQIPAVVIGGCVGDFFGEYMAGGTLVVLGLDHKPGKRLVGDYLASGIHGGEIFLRATPDMLPKAPYLSVEPVGADGLKALTPRLRAFAEAFSLDAEELLTGPFTRLTPISHRPFAAKYAPA